MEKDRQKIEVEETKKEAGKLETNAVQPDESVYGVTVGMGIYKPIPRFRGNCKNC
ncbi:hypothetical protein [Parabacteroides goldsteinii]|uniref:hypothetical protein n=1 Tax=Parabacteroides goldsteinii TaxID=328812 RepID=UPI002673ECFD|nr:hypothetical protein [Parabacteroides goldsteinii]